MATVPTKNLKANEVAELACTYAALILHDEGIDINGNKIAALVNAAGVTIDAFWPKLFAKALEGRNVADFFAVGGDAAEAAPAAAPAAAKKEEPKKEEKKDAKKPAEKPAPKVEEEDAGMGGLFDF